MSGKKRAPAQPEAVIRDVACEECGHVGAAGTVVVPYVFQLRGKRKWLCSIGTPRKCLEIAWQRFQPNGVDAVASGSNPNDPTSDVAPVGVS